MWKWERTSIDFPLLIIDYDDFVAKDGMRLRITTKLTREGKTFRKKLWQQRHEHIKQYIIIFSIGGKSKVLACLEQNKKYMALFQTP